MENFSLKVRGQRSLHYLRGILLGPQKSRQKESELFCRCPHDDPAPILRSRKIPSREKLAAVICNSNQLTARHLSLKDACGLQLSPNPSFSLSTAPRAASPRVAQLALCKRASRRRHTCLGRRRDKSAAGHLNSFLQQRIPART